MSSLYLFTLLVYKHCTQRMQYSLHRNQCQRSVPGATLGHESTYASSRTPLLNELGGGNTLSKAYTENKCSEFLILRLIEFTVFFISLIMKIKIDPFKPFWLYAKKYPIEHLPMLLSDSYPAFFHMPLARGHPFMTSTQRGRGGSG